MDDHETAAGGDDHYIEKVRRRAHAIWLDQGMLHGRDQEHWREAEQEIAAEEAERSAPKAQKPVGPTESVEGPKESSVKDASGTPVRGAA